MILVAGDPGNPETAQAIKLSDFNNSSSAEQSLRPISDALPSVVASSDIMGPGSLPPLQYLHEATLRNLQMRDPQDNVRQFLDFQHQCVATAPSESVPPTPPFEILSAQRPPHEGLRALPKLSIPSQTNRNAPKPASAHPLSALPLSALTYAPEPQSAVESSLDDQPPTALYRFASPFSEMDVPLTAVPPRPCRPRLLPVRPARHGLPPAARPGAAIPVRVPGFGAPPLLPAPAGSRREHGHSHRASPVPVNEA